MPFLRVLILIVMFFESAGAQTAPRGATSVPAPQRGAPPAPARGGATASSARVYANLGQLMKGILYPNSNVIFAAQNQNPAEVKPAQDPSTSTDPLASTYGTWEA